MALQQTYTNPITGSVSDYHRIVAARLDYAEREATITVLSYLNEAKRDEEKEVAKNEAIRKERDAQREQLMSQLDELLMNCTDANKKERDDLSLQIQKLDEEELPPLTIEPRFMYSTEYVIKMNTADDYTLEYAYNWLKTNVFKKSKDV